ncbi:hypothetical protein AZE42_10986 [Rhizopogon vesiculosus]|uniref:Cytochrome P450 n=1 Tax=Rhizopogon vesiculosus TaxID=180088 RepID=A0A1J8QGE8_9AGAM|nr:hypothetical protein AZE42_10986 [Rhizopogon vesiculosus]
MEKQSGTLADRPCMIAAGEMLTSGLSMGFLHTGNRLHRMRRVLHTHLQPKAAEEYQPLQMTHAKKGVLSILDDPHNFRNHTETYAATTSMKIAYGKDKITFATDPDSSDREAHQSNDRLLKVMRPGSYLVDTISWLKYIPWYGQELKRGFQSTSRRLHMRQLNHVRQHISNIDVGLSFAKHVLENGHSYGITEIEAAFLAGAFFQLDPPLYQTSMAICTVLMAAACFPEEQAKVLAELDAVIGRHRGSSIPFLQLGSIISPMETVVCQWSVSSWQTRPGQVISQQYDLRMIIRHQGDYCIPAGTTVSGNHWAISRDLDVFPEPHAFKPWRWIDD